MNKNNKIFNKLVHSMYSLSRKSRRTSLSYKAIAFTLFEALIVMTVLGIIATIMVTSIKPQEYKEKALSTAAKKVMNEIDHATNMILLNDSLDGTMYNLVATDGTVFSIKGYGSFEKSTRLANLYKKYLVTSRKECNDSTCQCYRYDSEVMWSKASYFYLKNGACMRIYTYSEETNSFFPGETTKTRVYSDARIRFDTNGSEEPNIAGKDRFNIPLGENGILYDAPAVEGGEEDDNDD